MFGLFGKKKSGAAVEAAPEPGAGAITAYDPADALGHVRLDSGAELRFGRSACVEGLEPAVGIRVQVREIEPHPRGGWRAKAMALAAGEAARAAALVDAQDQALGRAPLTAEQAASLAMQLGSLTVLLRDPPQTGRAGMQAFFEQAKLAELGITLDAASSALRRSQTSVTFDLGDGAFPADGVDRRFDPELAHLGRGFLAFRGGLPGFGLNLRLAAGSAPDHLGEAGAVRLVTQVALRLIATGLASGVIAHRAGQVLRPGNLFAALAADADAPAFRPFGAWTDLGLNDGVLASYGMDAFDLPDVAAAEAHPHLHPGEGYARAHEAVLAACHAMVHENRLLAVGEELAVPLGLEVGGYPLQADNPGLDLASAPRWRVSAFEARLVLEPVAQIPSLAEVWAKGAMPYPAYRAMLLGQFEAQNWKRVARMGFPHLPAAVPPHEVFVYQQPEGAFATFTCGFGRVPQPGGIDENDDRHIELLVNLPGHRPQIAVALSMLGGLIHLRGPDAPPIGPEHRIALGSPIPPVGIEHVVMGWRGKVELAPGPGISLFTPIIMTAEEKARVPSSEVPAWIATEGRRPEIAMRWLGHA